MLTLVVNNLRGWFAPSPVMAVPPPETLAQRKARRRADKAELARQVSRSVAMYADAAGTADASAQFSADAAHELAEAWFWLAGGDAQMAWDHRCAARRFVRLRQQVTGGAAHA